MAYVRTLINNELTQVREKLIWTPNYINLIWFMYVFCWISMILPLKISDYPYNCNCVWLGWGLQWNHDALSLNQRPIFIHACHRLIAENTNWIALRSTFCQLSINKQQQMAFKRFASNKNHIDKNFRWYFNFSDTNIYDLGAFFMDIHKFHT